TVSDQSGWEMTGQSHHVGARASGYLSAPDFLSFLDRAEGRVKAGETSTGSVVHRIKAGFLLFSDNPPVFLEAHGVWWTLLLILLGGLLLNLTPCVLPMIPINLAILGVGSQSRSKGRGIVLGSAYGVGIAFVYGVLGLVVVLTGAQFGTLNSFPWFNALIGFLFVVLALAMFDVWVIDFTRFQSNAVDQPERKRGGIVTAVVMGGVSALLAGACVAPVVIAVLLLSGTLFGQGAVIGLILPFVLGVGMALPWPLAGAGLTVLPKPGIWMRWIKVGFGVFILLFAFYYFSLAYRGWRGGTAVPATETGVSSISVTDHVKWGAILKDSVAVNKPVFVDFWATWCKNCETMELTTFRDAAVRDRLSRYRVVKLQVEKLTDPAARRVTDYFEIKGLPTYLILSPGTAP
ncbi:MAG: cytochrome c biogenesis protein CcdA, partial [bacterium]